MQNLSRALDDLKASTSNDQVLALIDRQEQLISESASARSDSMPDFDSILEDLIQGVPLDGEPDENVEILTHIVLNLYHTISNLETELDLAYAELEVNEQDPDNLADSINSFSESLLGAKINDLVYTYDFEYFKAFKPKTRVIMAQQLLEYAGNINKKPSSIWETIIANHGKI